MQGGKNDHVKQTSCGGKKRPFNILIIQELAMLIAPKKNSSMSKVKQEKFPILQQVLASPHL